MRASLFKFELGISKRMIDSVPIYRCLFQNKLGKAKTRAISKEILCYNKLQN